MPDTERISYDLLKERSTDDLLRMLPMMGDVGSQQHEQARMLIVQRYVEDVQRSIGHLTGAIAKASDSSANLERRIYHLNIVLVVATLVGVFGALVDLIWGIMRAR